MLAAAQALHLMPPAAALSTASHLGPESGSVGLSLAEYKLLADSDSESEEEPGPQAPVAPPMPAAAPALQQAKRQVHPGPVHKYNWDGVKNADAETLCKEFSHGQMHMSHILVLFWALLIK